MAISKTQCRWMALGGMLCLFGVVLFCKVREGNRASAQSDDAKSPPPILALPGPGIDPQMPIRAGQAETTQDQVPVRRAGGSTRCA